MGEISLFLLVIIIIGGGGRTIMFMPRYTVGYAILLHAITATKYPSKFTLIHNFTMQLMKSYPDKVKYRILLSIMFHNTNNVIFITLLVNKLIC